MKGDTKKDHCKSICGYGSLFLVGLYFLIQMSGQVVEIEEICDKPNTFTFPPFIDPELDPTIQSTKTFEAKLGESGKFQVTSADT